MGIVRRYVGSGGRLRWQDVAVEAYADPAISAVTRQVVIGAREGAAHYTLRYFEIEPGGKSSLDRHEHDHGVVILAGCGRLLLGEETHEIGFGDAIYIGPNEVHRFENTGDAPLGFLCVVGARPAARSRK